MAVLKHLLLSQCEMFLHRTFAWNSFMRSCTSLLMMSFAWSVWGSTCLANALYFLTASSIASNVLAPTTPWQSVIRLLLVLEENDKSDIIFSWSSKKLVRCAVIGLGDGWLGFNSTFSTNRPYRAIGVGWVSEWVSEQGLTSPSTHYRSFRRQIFPVNHLHWYWQPNKDNQETVHANNTKTTQHTKRP